MAQVAVYTRDLGSRTAPLFAEDPPEQVAVKFLVAPRRDLELESFRREAETLLMLRKYGKSPTLIKALSNVRSPRLGAPLPVYYFFMEYVEGQTLKELQTSERLPWDLAKSVALLKRIAMALIPAASVAQVHRDLHPGNIMITTAEDLPPHALIPEDPGIRILDFGVGRNWLAAQRDNWQEDRFRHPGAISSWSPELLSDPSMVDSKHDVWALGNLFYRMLTGDYAFFADNFRNYYEAVLKGAYDSQALQELPSYVSRFLKAMFEVQPQKRLSLGGVLKIATDISERGLGDWLTAHPALAELYFVVEGNIWTCPLCKATSNPTNDSRCRACGRYVEEFLLPF